MNDLHRRSTQIPDDRTEPGKLTAPWIAATTSFIGFAASIYQFVADHGRGLWALSLALGLLAVGLGAGFVKNVKMDNPISWVAIFFGALTAACSFFGVFGMIQNPLAGIFDQATTSTTEPTETASPSPTPTSTTSPTHTVTTSATLPVSLVRNESPPTALPLSVTATVNRRPSAGKHFWLVLQVTYPTGGVEFYGQKELTAGQGNGERVNLQIPTSANLSFNRVAHVWEVTPEMDQELRARLRQDVSNRSPYYQEDCSDCDVATPIQITP